MVNSLLVGFQAIITVIFLGMFVLLAFPSATVAVWILNFLPFAIPAIMGMMTIGVGDEMVNGAIFGATFILSLELWIAAAVANHNKHQADLRRARQRARAEALAEVITALSDTNRELVWSFLESKVRPRSEPNPKAGG